MVKQRRYGFLPVTIGGVFLMCLIGFVGLRIDSLSRGHATRDQVVLPSKVVRGNKTIESPATSSSTAGPTIYQPTTCRGSDLVAEKKLVSGMFRQALASSTTMWQMSFMQATTTQDAFASVYIGDYPHDILPCQYRMAYTIHDLNLAAYEHLDDLAGRLRSKITSWHGWYATPAQNYIQSDGTSTKVLLNVAGGAGIETDVYAHPLEGGQFLQFLRLTEERGGVHGLYADDPCPCTATVSLEISSPVPLSNLVNLKN